MKIAFFTALLLGASLYSNAQLTSELSQTPTHPEQRFNVGMVLSDFMISRFNLEAEYRVSGPSSVVIGIGTHMGYMDMDNRPFQENEHLANNIYTTLAYKYYFARTDRNNFPFARINLAYENSDVRYYGMGWTTEVVDGTTYYHYDEIRKYYHVEGLALGMELGVHLKGQAFYTDLSIGAQYKGVISNDTPPTEFTEYSGHFFNDIDYNGIAPRFRAKMGFYLD